MREKEKERERETEKDGEKEREKERICVGIPISSSKTWQCLKCSFGKSVVIKSSQKQTGKPMASPISKRVESYLMGRD